MTNTHREILQTQLARVDEAKAAAAREAEAFSILASAIEPRFATGEVFYDRGTMEFVEQPTAESAQRTDGTP